MKCNDSKKKNSKYNNNTLHKYVNALRGRKFKCDEKDLFDKRMFLHVDNSNNNGCKKTRNHLPSIDVTRHTFTNNNINNSNNTITVSKNALRIYKPFTCRDNSNLLHHQHQYSNSLSTQVSNEKDYYNLDYSLHNTYSQFLLGNSHKTKSSNKYQHHHHRRQETFEYFTFVPSSKHMKSKQRMKSDIVNMKYNVNVNINDNNKSNNNMDKELCYKYKDKKDSYVNKEEFWTVKGAKRPYHIANAIREENMRKLHKRKLDDIEIKPTNTFTSYNSDNDTY
jgi:hypothetical protein